MIELCEYQRNLLERVEQSLSAENARVMMQLPTGAGKTVIAAHLLRKRLTGGRKAVWITHRRELATQTREMLRCSAGVNVSPPSSWARGSPAPYLPNGVVIVMAQTTGRRAREANIWDRYGKDHYLIVDEAHHATASGWERTIRRWPGRVLGMTATPWRLSVNEGFDHLFSDLASGPQVSELQAEGFLCNATVVMPSDDRLIRGGEIGRIGDYTDRGIEEANLPDVMTANALRFWREQTPNRQTIVYAVSVDHAHNLAAVFEDAGFAVAVMLGETPSDERADIIARFESGNLQVLINVAVATEGFDLPDASCVVIARPTTSLSLYLQMVGRGLRPKPNGGDCVILDLAGNVMTHGLPEDHREWSLSARGVEGEGDAPVVRCERCGAVSPAASHKCKRCGDPFGAECGRCGRWRAWKRWGLENVCEYAHDTVCDLCHADAHVQAQLPVTDEMDDLSRHGDAEREMEIHESDLDHSLAEIIRELLEEERQRVDSARYERQIGLRDQIDARERELSDSHTLEYLFEEHLTMLSAEMRPRSFPERSRAYVEWEDSLRENLIAWNRELSDLENRPIDGAAILNSARNKLTSILRREAEDMGLVTGTIKVPPPEDERGDWISLTELQPAARQSPRALRLPAGEEISIRHWADILAKAADWLVSEGRFSESDCPFTLGRSTLHFIDREGRHPDGRAFRTSRQMENGMFINADFSSTQLLNNCARFLREFGGDPSQFYVKM